MILSAAAYQFVVTLSFLPRHFVIVLQVTRLYMFPVFRTVLFCLQLSVFLGKDLILEVRSFPLGSDLNSIPFAKNKGKAKPMSIFLFIFTWCWTVIMICAWQGNIHWCELHYLRDGSRIEQAYIEKGRSGVNNLWQVQCASEVIRLELRRLSSVSIHHNVTVWRAMRFLLQQFAC